MTGDPLQRQLAYLDRLRKPRTLFGYPASIDLPGETAEPKADSHLLALAASPFARGRLLDTFSGSGVVAAWLARKIDRIDLVEINTASAQFLERVAGDWPCPVQVFASDVFPPELARYDIITANPPYTDHPTRDTIDSVCFDPGHGAVTRFISGLSQRLTPDGSAFLSWANFASFAWLEAKVVESGLSCDVCAHLSEPVSPRSGEDITYRVYRVRLAR